MKDHFKPTCLGIMYGMGRTEKPDKPALEARKMVGASTYASLDILLAQAVIANPETIAVFEADMGGGFWDRFFIVRTGGKRAEVDLSGVLEAGEVPCVLRRWVFVRGVDAWEERLVSGALR